MAVDKNLFLYDLAIISVMKNEAPYVKEWLDYHLLAGVEHFYIFDNESPDNLKEVLQPYIDAEIVTYKFHPGKLNMMAVYNEVIKEYKYFCRYIAFIDADEFIFPKSNKSIVEVTDEILKDNPNAGGLAANWQIFGSNYLEKADYSKGVLERFTRRAPKGYNALNIEGKILEIGNVHVKTITNPRRIKLWDNPHYAQYFQGFNASNENGDLIKDLNNPVTVEKIAVYHYAIKSYEEAAKRRNLNLSPKERQKVIESYNEEFDDSILAYRDARLKMGGVTLKPLDYEKLTATLIQNLAPTLNPNVPAEFFEGKLETFLTCRALCSYLKEFLADKEYGRILEETALNAIQKTLHTNNISMTDANLLIAELPKILPLNYPVVEDIRKDTINIISSMKDLWASQFKSWGQPDRAVIWENWKELDYIFEILKTFEKYQQK